MGVRGDQHGAVYTPQILLCLAQSSRDEQSGQATILMLLAARLPVTTGGSRPKAAGQHRQKPAVKPFNSNSTRLKAATG